MTAVVGILNKSGVAIAADSAVTINVGKGRKIYNTAYKIFTLSKIHPVSITMYNSALFMDIPWEIIIKEYRKELKEKSYPTLEYYQKDFLKYLNSKVKFVSKDLQKFTLNIFIESVFNYIISDITESNINKIEKFKTLKEKRSFLTIEVKKELNNLTKRQKEYTVLVKFKDYKYDSFVRKHNKILNELYNKYFKQLGLTRYDKSKLYRLIHRNIVTNYFVGTAWTGLIFIGYGEQEIYPSCLPIKVGEVFDNRIRYAVDSQNIAVIGDKTSAVIRPFAQRDVIDLILSGIDSNLQTVISYTFRKFLTEFIDKIKSQIGTSNPTLTKNISNVNIEELIKIYSSNINEACGVLHIDPLMATISSLTKEDLAELAESLVYLTYLKRRISFSEESVGGPVDVAVITKGDGFIWIKRKHYFDHNINQHFFERYFKYV